MAGRDDRLGEAPADQRSEGPDSDPSRRGGAMLRFGARVLRRGRRGPLAWLLFVGSGVWALMGVIVVIVAIVGGQLQNADAACSGSSAPDTVAGIPSELLRIYGQAAATYQLGPDGWSYLAAINKIETDFGQTLATSGAGAVGWMQFEPGTWAKYRVTPTGAPAPNGPAGWNDPVDAIYTAANYLHAMRAPGDWGAALYAYNNAYWYVDEVTAKASEYQIAAALGTTSPAPQTPTEAACLTADVQEVPGDKAQILPTGDAAAPADAPPQVKAMIAAGNRINHFAYVYGGGHGAPAQSMNQTSPDPAAAGNGDGYDCSAATDYLLYAAGFGQSMLGGDVPDSLVLATRGVAGEDPAHWVTVYANLGHAYIEVAGIYFDTAAGSGHPPNQAVGNAPNTGPRWVDHGTGPAGFTPRHPPGL